MHSLLKTVAAIGGILLAIVANSDAHAAKSGVSPGVISLPKGPGSVSGLGESFKPDLNTGSMTYRVPLKVPSGVGGLTPSVALSYSSGGGNSEVGFSWSLGVPKIQIRTEKGIPRYDGSDIYTVTGVGSGELVPLASGFYRLEIEGAYIRAQQGPNGWEVRDKSGKIYRFGYTVESRCEDGSRVFAWYLTDQYDTLGNQIEYVYEQHGGRPYLRWIRYNNFSADVVAEVEFTYEARRDALANYRAGFKVIQGQRLIRIESSVGGQLLARYALEYDTNSYLSRLARVSMVGTDGETGLPPLSLSYYAFDPDASEIVTMSTPPGVSPGLADNALADLNGDSFPDLLITSSGNFEYYLNDGGTGWEARDSLPQSPSVALSYNGVQLADVDGDGRIDLLAKLGPGAGDFRYFPADESVGFGSSVSLTNNPDFSFEDPEVRLFDVTGDGRADVVRTTVGELLVYENLGGGSYADGQVLPEIDSAMQVMFSYTDHVRLADMNGDGLIDVAYLRSNSVVYWPQMGGGRFDSAVTMANAPTLPDMTWVKLRDLNGDGLGDLVRVGINQVEYWLNQGDGTYGALQTIVDTPYRDPINTAVEFADMNGNGSTDIVWIDVTGSPDEAWRYLDVMGANRPGLLHRADNGLGKVLRAEYSSSGEMSSQARRDGDPWTVELPVSTQVVSRITTDDSLGNTTVTEMVYRDGFYDGAEREFRGFAESTNRAIGDAHTPTLLAFSEYDTGKGDKARRGLVLTQTAETDTGEVFSSTEYTYMVFEIATGTNGKVVRHARLVSAETEHLEKSSTPRITRTDYDWDEYGRQISLEEWGEVVGGDPRAGDDEKVTRTSYATNTTDWILSHVSESVVESADGSVLRRTRHYYDGNDFEGLSLGEVDRGLLMRTDRWLARESRWIPHKRSAYDAWGNLIALRDARGNERRVDWDEQTHRLPLAERIVLDGRELVFRVENDQLQGVITASTDLNDNRTKYIYDAMGRLIAIVRPGDSPERPTVTYRYDLAAPLSAVWTHQRIESGSDETLDSVRYTDGLGRIRGRRQLAENGQWVELEAAVYDARGKKAITIRPYLVSTYDWEVPDTTQPAIEIFRDALARRIRWVMEDDSESRVERSPLMTRIFDANDTDSTSPHYNTPTIRKLDGQGRLVAVEEDTGGGMQYTRSYFYDAAGSLIRFEDAEGHSRIFSWDSFGLLVATTHPDAGTWTYGYDDVGNKTHRRDPQGGVIRWEYDEDNRKLREVHVTPEGSETTFATFHYDVSWSGHSATNVLGRLAWVEDNLGIAASSYDVQGRQILETREVDGQRHTMGYAYDAADRLKELVYPDDTAVAYEYNERSLISKIPGYIESQEWSPSGLMTSRQLGNGVTVQWRYDARERISQIDATGPLSDTLQDLALSYDPAGNVVSVVDGRAEIAPEQDRSVQGRYDALNRLVEATGNGYNLGWSYSACGNILSTSGQITPAVSTQVFGNYHYGENGAGPHAVSRVEVAGGSPLQYRYNGAGGLISTPQLMFTYNALHQIAQVEKSDGEMVVNVYRHDGMRGKRTVTRATGMTETSLYLSKYYAIRNDTLVKYIYAGADRIVRVGETDSAEQSSLPSTTNSATAPVIFGSFALLFIVAVMLVSIARICLGQRLTVGVRRWAAVALLLGVSATTCRTSEPPPEPGWPSNAVAILTDHLNTVHLLVDARGQVVSEQNHLPYGVERYRRGQATVRYGYNGKEADGSTQLVYYGHRFLIPGLAVWNRPDPLYLHSPSKVVEDVVRGNAYGYVAGNPLTKVDPTGLRRRPRRRYRRGRNSFRSKARRYRRAQARKARRFRRNTKIRARRTRQQNFWISWYRAEVQARYWQSVAQGLFRHGKAGIWRANQWARGHFIEGWLARTKYRTTRGYWRVGQLNRGFFPLIDFVHPSGWVISVKSVNTASRTNNWYGRMQNHVDALHYASFLYRSRSGVRSNLRKKLLDIQLPPGATRDFGTVLDLRRLQKYGAPRGVTVRWNEFK